MAETLPPIHSSRGSLASESHSHPMSDSSTSSARAGHTAATTAVAAPTSAVDELAARLAKRIWAGSKEEDGYVTMITRVRQQFLAQSSEIDPLVLPPMVPSSQRPVEPEIPQFSRRLQAFQPSERSKSGRKAIMPAKGEESSTATSAAVPPSAASVAQLPSVPAVLRPLFSRQHKKQQTDVERIKQQMAAAEAEDYSYVPMYNLPGRRAKALRLLELEQLSREHIFASEKWNRQLVSEMMIVSYVTGVLKPEVEELLTKERHVRSAVRAEEEGEWCALLHQHPLAETIQRELAAIAARESKLARLEPHRPPKANSGNSSPAERKSPRDNETDPRDIVANYEKHNKRNSTSLTVLSPTDNTTQQLLHNNVSLPPIAGRPVLRNALGLADCMALIDEDAQRRHLIMSAEVDEREDLMGIAHDEHTAIRNWQRKRMHLERLIYWKVEREEHLQTELNRMTDVRQAAVTLDPETEHHLLAQEEEERVELTLRATEGVSKLMKRLQELHLRHYHDRLEAEYERAWTIEWESSCRMRVVLVQYHEQFLREQCVHAWRSWAKTDATAAYTSVSALAAAALNRPKLWAIYRLQRAFRKCILGRFGWHHTHVEIGREIQTGRIQRKVEEGRAAINTCKDSIAHSFRKIEAEIDAEFDARKVVVVAEEKEARFAIDTQELWGFGLIRQHCRKEQQNNFHGPESARLQGDERTTRTEDVLREEVVRGKLEVLRQEKQIQ